MYDFLEELPEDEGLDSGENRTPKEMNSCFESASLLMTASKGIYSCSCRLMPARKHLVWETYGRTQLALGACVGETV